MPLVPDPKNCDISVKRAIQGLSKKLGYTGSPTYAGLTLTGLTSSTLIGTNASKALESVTIGTGLDYTRPTLSLSHLGIEALTDPGADRIFFWDNSASASEWLAVGNSIAITTTTIDTIQDIRTTASPTLAGLTTTNATVLSSNSVIFQPNTDSTTFLQVLDADGGTPILNINSTNERVGVRTASPSTALDVSGTTTSITFNATNEDDILQAAGTTVFRVSISDANIFIGDGAAAFDTVTGVRNTAIGKLAASRLNSGFNNFALGNEASFKGTSAHDNFAIGTFALRNNVVGNYNVAIGTSALQTVLGGANTGIGFSAGRLGTSATFNTVIGYKGGYNLSTGDRNIYIGSNAGINQTSNSDLLIIDNQDRGSAAVEITNCLIYGIFNSTVTSQSIRFNVGDLTLASSTPYQTLWNITHEDTDGGGESRLIFKREDGAGTETACAQIEAAHGGSGANDTKGMLQLSVNNGTSLIDVIEIDEDLNTKIGDAGVTNYTNFAIDGSMSQTGTARIDWTKITANGVTIRNAHGTTASAVSDLQTAHDGNVYTLSEESGETPGMDIEVDFTGVTAFNWVQILARYEQAVVSHGITVMLEITPFNGSAWHRYDYFSDQGADLTNEEHSFFVPDDSAYINSGVVKVRFVHEMAGTSSNHDLVIDVCALYQ